MTSFVFRNVLLVTCLIGLAACTGSTVEQTLAPQPIAANTTEIPQSSNAVAATQGSSAIGYATEDPSALNSTTASQVAALDLSKSVAFVEVEGAPQAATTSMYKSLETRASVHGLNMVNSSQTGAQYRVKGYFSALNDGTGTLLVYIWDVYDRSGKRVHRINGRERGGGATINPWQSVTDAQLSAMADSTTAKLSSWINARS